METNWSRPGAHRLFERDGLFVVFMGCKVSHGVGGGPLLLIAMKVRGKSGQHRYRPLYSHTKVQGPTALSKFHPGPELAQAEGFFGLRDRLPTDAREDEFVPDFVEFGELGVFPRSLTS